MAISARLSRVLHHQLGDDAGEDLINWMGQMESNRSELREVMDGYIALTNSRFAESESRMEARFALSEMRTEVRFVSLEARFEGLEARFGSLEARFETRFGTVDSRMEGLAGAQARMNEASAQMRGDLIAAIQKVRVDVILWSFAFWSATMLAMIAPRLFG